MAFFISGDLQEDYAPRSFDLGLKIEIKLIEISDIMY